jgi:hypothetical protein
MSVVVTLVALINEALARLGSEPVSAADEETPTARKAAQIAPTVLGQVYGATSWHFARRTRKLDRLAAVPETGFRYAYALPGDRIGEPVKVLTNPQLPDYPLRHFVVEGGELHANVEAVWVTCVLDVEPATWPPLFRAAFVTALAAELAVPQAHDVNLADSLRIQAWGTPSEGGRGGLIGRAMSRDAAQAPSTALLATDPLTAARDGGGWHGAY